MKAIICTAYGPPEVLRPVERERPIPAKGEILVRIRATTANAADARIRGAVFPPLVWLPVRLALGLTGPRKEILGVEIAGEVETVGEGVTRFRPGDRVFGSTGFQLGGYAEYVCLPENAVLAGIPAGIDFEEAAAVPQGALTALAFLRKAGTLKGRKVLVVSAAGSIGSYAVQLARHFGATVTGLCGPTKLDRVKSLGAHAVLDYTKHDVGEAGERYDVIFDTAGKGSYSGCLRALAERGVFLRAVHLELGPILKGLWTSITSGKKVVGGMAVFRSEDLAYLAELLEAGTIRPVIDRSYPLDRAAEAHAYVDQGHKTGNVVLTVGAGPR